MSCRKASRIRRRRCAREPEHSEVVQRPAATEAGSGQRHLEPRRLQHLHGRLRGLRLEIVAEGVGPEKHAASASGCGNGSRASGRAARGRPRRFSPGEPGAKGLERQLGELPIRRDPGESPDRRRGRRRLGEPVRDGRRARAPVRPTVNEAHRVSGTRAQPAGVVTGKKLGLVRRDVDADGAFGLAGLAGEAQVEGFPHAPVAPASADRFASQHLEEKMRAATGRVGLLARDHEARAHTSTVEPPALAHSDAALERAPEIASIRGIAELRGRGHRLRRRRGRAGDGR